MCMKQSVKRYVYKYTYVYLLYIDHWFVKHGCNTLTISENRISMVCVWFCLIVYVWRMDHGIQSVRHLHPSVYFVPLMLPLFNDPESPQRRSGLAWVAIKIASVLLTSGNAGIEGPRTAHKVSCQPYGIVYHNNDLPLSVRPQRPIK